MIDQLTLDRDRYYNHMQYHHNEFVVASKEGKTELVELHGNLFRTYGDLTLHACYAIELEQSLKHVIKE